MAEKRLHCIIQNFASATEILFIYLKIFIHGNFSAINIQIYIYLYKHATINFKNNKMLLFKRPYDYAILTEQHATFIQKLYIRYAHSLN